MTNGESFSRIRRWIDEINKYCDESIAKVLVGNKDDDPSEDAEPVQKIVSTADAEQYANQMKLTFFETSAKDNKNVFEAFHAITKLALERRLDARTKSQDTQNNNIVNGVSVTQPTRLKLSKKIKRKDKKFNASCCN